MITFIIIDRDPSYRSIIKDIVIKNMMSNKINFEIYEYDNTDKKLVEHVSKANNIVIYIIGLSESVDEDILIAKHIRYEANDWISPIIVLTSENTKLNVYSKRLQILDSIIKDNNLEKLHENINTCINMLNSNFNYKYTYKNIDYLINYSSIDYIQRDGRRIKIVTSNNVYYQNISIKQVKEKLPPYFIPSSKGTLINKNNISFLDWNNLMVKFKDGKCEYIISKAHKKDLDD